MDFNDMLMDTMKMAAVNFADWVHKKRYVKYWGNEGENCGKWYIGYTPPDRKYYTTDELFELFFIDEKERIENENKSQV